MNREGAKDAKFLSEPGAGLKKVAAYGSAKDACIRSMLKRGSGDHNGLGDQPPKTLAFFLIVSHDQEKIITP